MDAKDVVLRQHDAVWCRGDLSVVDECSRRISSVGIPALPIGLDAEPSRTS